MRHVCVCFYCILQPSSSVVKSSVLGQFGKQTTTDTKKRDSQTTSDARKTAPSVAARPDIKQGKLHSVSCFMYSMLCIAW